MFILGLLRLCEALSNLNGQIAAENLNYDASEPVVILGFGQMGQVAYVPSNHQIELASCSKQN